MIRWLSDRAGELMTYVGDCLCSEAVGVMEGIGRSLGDLTEPVMNHTDWEFD